MGDSSIQASQIEALEDKLNEVIDKLNLLLSRHLIKETKKIDLYDLDY